jgi:hypothetical protein
MDISEAFNSRQAKSYRYSNRLEIKVLVQSYIHGVLGQYMEDKGVYH